MTTQKDQICVGSINMSGSAELQPRLVLKNPQLTTEEVIVWISDMNGL